MPHQIDWLIEQKIILTTFEGQVEQVEIQGWVEQIDTFVTSINKIVHHISDSRRLEKMNISIGSLQSFLKMFNLPSHFGWHIEINVSPLSQLTLKFIHLLFGPRVRFCSNLEEAYYFLQEQDSTLPDFPLKK